MDGFVKLQVDDCEDNQKITVSTVLNIFKNLPNIKIKEFGNFRSI